MAGKSCSKFKAIIIGGSVAGLTLAHTFDSAGIDYVLLEARDTIAPPLGATLVIQANGARILEQLGVYERLSNVGIMTKMSINTIRRSDGRVVNVNEWPRLMEQKLGYAPGIFERQKFLQGMYDQLKHKEKVHVTKNVVSILDRENSVLVKCADGTTYRGDIVVGADGIHSIVRREMQRIVPRDLLINDKESVTAEYACLFGVSAPIPELEDGALHTAFEIDHSALLFGGNGHLPQWFFITKMDRKYCGHDIPRYTKKEMEEQVLQHGNFQLTKGITLKDLLATQTALSYLALEEASHELWTYKRIVCVGDSIHKMTPNLGQGGNQAIEGAAVLTNCLLDMFGELKGDGVGIEAIKEALMRYQKLRAKRAQKFIKLSGLATRDEAMAELKQTLRFLFVPPPTSDMISDFQVRLYRSAPYLHHLPLPRRLEALKAWECGSDNTNLRLFPKAQL